MKKKIILLTVNTLIILCLSEWIGGGIVKYYKSVRWHDEYIKLIGAWGWENDWGEYGDCPSDMDRIWPSWRRRAWLAETNDGGFRNIEDIDWSANTTRILAIGDSMTFGPFLANEDTWPSWLQEILRKKFDQPVQVLNAGIMGSTIGDMYEYLVDKGLDVKPALVIYGFYQNDITDYLPAYRKGHLREDKKWAHEIWPFVTKFKDENKQSEYENKGFGGLLRQYNLYILASMIKHDIYEYFTASKKNENIVVKKEFTEKAAKGKKQNRPGLIAREILRSKPEHEVWQKFYDDLKKTINLLNENEIPFLIVNIPDFSLLPPIMDQLNTDSFLSQTVKNESVSYIDLLPLFIERGSIETCYFLNYDTLRVPNRKLVVSRGEINGNIYIGNNHISRYGSYLIAYGTAKAIEADAAFANMFGHK